MSDIIKVKSNSIVNAKSASFLGEVISHCNGRSFKLKEITYIHAEGYASGEMKHGPIALVDDKVPVVIILPKDSYLKKISLICRKSWLEVERFCLLQIKMEKRVLKILL